MATLLELAQISSASYNLATIGSGLDLKNDYWSIIDELTDEPSHYHGVAYRNTRTGEIVIANRGTDPASLKDLWSGIEDILPVQRAFVVAGLIKKSIHRLSLGPIRTHPRNTRRRLVGKTCRQLDQPIVQTLVTELRTGKFLHRPRSHHHFLEKRTAIKQEACLVTRESKKINTKSCAHIMPSELCVMGCVIPHLLEDEISGEAQSSVRAR